MFDNNRLVVIWKVRRLERMKFELLKGEWKEAQKKWLENNTLPTKEDVGELLDNTIAAGKYLDEHIAVLETDYWLEQARKYLLPTPPESAYIKAEYVKARAPRPFYYLNKEALHELRTAVRKEQRERSENLRAWATLSIGLIGTLIGLVAMLKK